MRGDAAAGPPSSHGDPVDLLRVGIDGRAFASPAAGVRRYAGSLVPALLALGEPLEIVALGGSASSLPAGVAHIKEPAHPPTNVGWTIVGLPRAARRAGVHLIHAPSYTAPWWTTVPVVVSIHDVVYERHPEWYPYRRDAFRRAFYRRSAVTAAHVLTISRFSAGEISAAYGIPADRITVTPLGVDPHFSPRTGGLMPARRPYVLHVGDLHERRNLVTLLDAVMMARRSVQGLEQLSLVLVGTDRGVGHSLRRRASSAGMDDLIEHHPHVGEAALVDLYRGALALAYPSLYEGFGLPLVEAMASGTPVIASTAASIPEVTGTAGLLLDPHNVAEWTAAITALWTDVPRREQLRAAGLARAKEFTWERTARLTLAVYRRVA